MNARHAGKPFALGIIAFAVVLVGGAFNAGADSADKAQIQALEQQLAATIAAKDLNKIMQFYAPGEDLFVFDLIPPRQYVGAAAWRKNFEGFYTTVAAGPMTVELSDLDVMTDGKLGFTHYTSHITSSDKDGKKFEMVMRTTDVLKKIKGKWLIVHEHNSVPVDLATGKADLMSKQYTLDAKRGRRLVSAT
jgi:uncharacterized protein (TIGR02246 family)